MSGSIYTSSTCGISVTEHVISRGTPVWRETWSFLGGKIGEIGRLTTPFLGTKDEGKWYQRKEYCVKNLGLTPLTFQVKTKYKHWKAFLRLFWNLPNYWLIFKSFFSCFSMTSDNSSAPPSPLSFTISEAWDCLFQSYSLQQPTLPKLTNLVQAQFSSGLPHAWTGTA